MRLRQLTEAECYARCYGRVNRTERVTVVHLPVVGSPRITPGEELRLRFEALLDDRGPEAAAA